MTDRILDQNFDMPPNVVGLKYAETQFDGMGETDPEEVVEGIIIDETDYVEPDEATGGSQLLPPDDITLIEWDTKIGADGTVLVDGVFNVEGTPGTSGYEVKVLKL